MVFSSQETVVFIINTANEKKANNMNFRLYAVRFGKIIDAVFVQICISSFIFQKRQISENRTYLSL